MGAAKEGHLPVTRFLVESGASINVQNAVRRYTALHYACDGDKLEVAEYLITKGADTSMEDIVKQSSFF